MIYKTAAAVKRIKKREKQKMKKQNTEDRR